MNINLANISKGGFQVSYENGSEILIGTATNSDLMSIYDGSLATVDQSREEALAVAQLVIAAPALLTALEALVADCNEETLRAAKSAIALANTTINEYED